MAGVTPLDFIYYVGILSWILLGILLITVVTFILRKEKTPAWLKGSAIGGIIVAVFSFVGGIITSLGGDCGFFDSSAPSFSLVCWFPTLAITSIVLLPFLVLGAIAGTFIDFICKSKEPSSFKGLKIGFFIGLLSAVFIIGIPIVQFLFFATGLNLSPAILTFALGFMLVGVLVGWLIGKYR